jgi:outer membrane protein OmpA-like peptidoglycan-associated protein
MLMVSHANTNPGLTKAWEPGEPDKYYPTGKRNYARVITTDDYQGSAAAQFAAQDLKLKRCFVLNDNQTYGQGVAKAFADEAAKQGITILGNEAWDAKQPNYTALFTRIKATSPDCIYLGGIFDNNGGQLVKDKVAVLGDNTAMPMIAPDGFTGYPDFQKLPQAQGTYLTFAGLATEQLQELNGAGAALLNKYKEKYGAYPSTSYALYGVAAVQVMLAAIAKSDGTRKSINDAVFSGDGITISATDSVLGKEIKILAADWFGRVTLLPTRGAEEGTGRITEMKHRFITVAFCVVGLTLFACRRAEPPPPQPVVVQTTQPVCAEQWVHMPMLINFPTGGATIDEQNRVILGEMVRTAQSRTDIRRVRVEGHTDTCGNELNNMQLSNERAVSVANELVVMGVPREMIETVGYGSTQPRANEACEREAALSEQTNRRVEFSLLVCRGGTY